MRVSCSPDAVLSNAINKCGLTMSWLRVPSDRAKLSDTSESVTVTDAPNALLLAAMAVETNVEALSASFPLTLPVPTPFTHPSLISIKDLHREEDLLRNPSSFRQWWSAVNTTREAQNALLKLEPLSDISPETRSLLGPLSSPAARQSLQRLTYLYEAALANFPNSFKLWKSYLQMRMTYVLGKQLMKKRAGGKKRLPDMKDALEDEQEDMEQWDGGLDGVVGWEEWKALIATFERALMWLPKVRQ